MKKRVEWIDITRGIGILLVVLGHSVTTVIRNDSRIAMGIFDAVYFVHVPLLLFVSGVAFDLGCKKYAGKSFKSYTVGKFVRLMFPYISYSLLVYLIFSAANMVPKLSSILEKMSYGRISIAKWLFNLLVGNNIYCEHVWYLYTLFVLSILAYILVKISGKWYKYILMALTILMWVFLRYPSDYDVIWKTAQRGIWFALGCIAGAEKTYSKTQKCAFLFSGAVAVIIKVFFLEMMQESMIEVRNVVNMVLIGVLMFTFAAIAQILEQLGVKRLKWFGQNSMCIYLFHQPFFGSGLGVVLYSILHLPAVISIVVAFIACIAIPLLINELLKQPKLMRMRFLLLGE